jgi:hypothetical protein
MVVDRYTKAVLTIIAACLVWLCAVGTPGAVHAQQPTIIRGGLGQAVPVIVVGSGTITRAGDVAVTFRGDRSDPNIPVTLPYSMTNPLPAQLHYLDSTPMPIEVRAVRKSQVWDALRVEVEDAPLRSRPGIGRQ